MDQPNSDASSTTSEEIIELTDIVEQGVVPPSTAAADGAGLKAQMGDLMGGSKNSGNSDDEDDFDLEALLASTTANAQTENPSQAGNDEGLPELGDVDALLRDLVMPDQPGTAVSSADPTPEAASSEADLAGVTPIAATAASSGENEIEMDELDGLLASLDQAPPKSEASEVAEEAEIEDLDSLLDSIMNPEVAEPEAVEPEAAEPEAAEPEVAEPEVAEPEVAEPEVAELEAAEVAGVDSVEGESPLAVAEDIPTAMEAAETVAVASLSDDAQGAMSEPEQDKQAVFVAEPEEVDIVPDIPAAGVPADATPNIIPDLSANMAALADSMAVLQEEVRALAASSGGDSSQADSQNAGNDVGQDVMAQVQEKLRDFHAELDDFGDRFAQGLTMLDERISALEAGASGKGEVEARLAALEGNLERAAADAAAKVIREEITALFSEISE